MADEQRTWDEELTQWLEAGAREEGFDACGVAGAEPGELSARFANWVDAGHAGEMEWLKRRDEAGVLVRSAVRVALPWARSVVVCAINYNADAPRSINPAAQDTGWIGRYAWSGRQTAEGIVPVDYHDDLIARLLRVEAEIQARASCQTRCYVDTGPLVERDAAARAGVGWVGKNTCVLRPGLGSWMLLGVIVTSLPVAPEAAAIPHPDRCGSCTRCIDACPTGALLGEREMDASRCIAYLTIEKKGTIPYELRQGIGRQVFGCDICQEVCPWNRKAPVAAKPGIATRSELVNPLLQWLADMDAAGFRSAFKGSPLERTGRRRLRRNVAIAMGNSHNPAFASTLREWAGGEDAVLAESAAWALGRLAGTLTPQPQEPVAPLLAFEAGGDDPAGMCDAD